MSKRFLLFLILCTLPFLAFTDIGFYETEPNDEPADFHEIAGAITLYGTMLGVDQDGYFWTVSDNDARKRWTFMLNGEPGALTITSVFILKYAENGIDVESQRKLFTMGTRDGVTPSVHENLLFEPGEYVIGLAQAGAGNNETSESAYRPPLGSLSFGNSETQDDPQDPAGTSPAAAADAPPPNTKPGAYRMEISTGTNINPTPGPQGRDSMENAHTLRLRSEFSTFDSAESAWYKLSFDESHADTRWDLKVQAPIGRDLRARLLNAAGEETLKGQVNDKGKLRFPDLAPTAGTTWFLELTTRDPGFIHVISTEEVGQKISGEEAEPNTAFNFANRIEYGAQVTGRIGGDDTADHFKFTTDENAGDELKTLRLETVPPTRISLCLTTGQQGQVQCRAGDAPLELPDLAFDPGEWAITLSRAAAEASYVLSWVDQGPVQPGMETEPNELIQHARGIPDNLRVKGRFSGDDIDFYEIMVTDEPQLWRFQVMGDEIFEVGYYDGSLTQKAFIRARPGERRIRLENVFLLPGRHFIRVQGKDGGSYTLLARALGPPDPNGEIEPNDQFNKQRLAIGQTRTGIAGDTSDQDFYRFFVGNWDHLRLTMSPAADGLITPNIYWYNQIIGQGQPAETGKPMVMQGLFPPGDYTVVLQASEPSDAEYSLSLERLPRFSCPSDCEPNGHSQIWLTAPIPGDLVLQGNTGEWRDSDFYQLPVFDQPTELHLLSPEPVRLSIGQTEYSDTYLNYDAEFGGYKTVIPAGELHRLSLETRGTPYRVELVFPNGEMQPVTESLPVDLNLELEGNQVAAYYLHGQRLKGTLSLSNTGAQPIQARLEATTSDHRWQVNLKTETVTVPAAGATTVDLDVLVSADAWALDPVRISARAVDDTGRQTEAAQDVTVDRDIAAVNPELYWSMPESLRGGLNAAWKPFGAEWTADTPDWATRTDIIRDGLVFAGSRSESGYIDHGEYFELTLDLPGEELLPVAGTAIDAFGYEGALFDTREATLFLSEDGVTFTEALQFEALPVKSEQQFALEQPVLARFARLRINSTFHRPATMRAFVSEWKVILEPGFNLAGGHGYNIADPELGGHLLADFPPEPNSPRNVLTPDDAPKAALLRGALIKDYVIGFHQNRAAQITAIDWLYGDDAREEWKLFDPVTVAVSMESPVGPWLPLGELTIDPESKNGTLKLPEPAWARFVRLSAHRKPEDSTVSGPSQILIHERPTGPDYHSVLSEWGTKGHRAFYEQHKGLEPAARIVSSENTSRQRAAILATATPTAGQVSLGKLEHWYKMTVPAGENTLKITISGDPTVRTVVELETAGGEAIPLRRIERTLLPSQHEFEAVVEPGSEVYLHVYEPPRNVAFSWDTSASVLKYIPMINNAILAFSSQVVPGKEAVNLFPFPTGPLLKDWLGEPYMLQTILNDYRRPSSSSSAEVTLKYATQALEPLPGTKAIVVITDGDVVHDGDMWVEYQTTQPRVFSLQVAGAERIHQSLMRDWSSVNGGHYTQLLYEGEMEVAFDRATTLMHRPAGYTLLVESEYREAPGPGQLLVIAGENSTAGGAAVELILDASGSMLQRLDGKRRINIAREVLTEAVNEHIPAGTPVALRVFGHKEVDSCRTDLEIPLGPLDPAAATATIASINAMNLARTPIADSLAAVAGDLQGASGGTIVLVTDGEETCEGDPAVAIKALQDRGFDVNLNIVGFAIEDAGLAAQFESWAEAGGGRYFGADNQDGLDEAIEQALQISFTVFDQGGNEIAVGQVGGEPVELEQGIYNVIVRTQPPQRFENVDVVGESEVSLQLD